MSKAPTLKVIPKSLDVAALEAMAEPLTVQVSRIKGNQHTPIPLPVGEEGAPAGTGMSKTEVQEMNGGWLVNNWSGGGLYQFTVTDSSNPPQVLTWQSWWPPTEHPERVPPTLLSAPRQAPGAPPAPVAQIVSQPQPQVTHMPAFPNGLPQVAPGPIAAPTIAPSPSYGYQPYAQPYQPMYQPYSQPYSTANAAAEAERRRYEEQLAQMQKQLSDARIESERRNFEAQLERERAANAAAMQRLEAQIAEMGRQMQMAQKPTGNPELEALRAQLENERRERETERRERETRDQMVAMKQSIDAQIVAMREGMQQLVAASANKGMDPMMQVMMEQSRNSIAAMERIANQSNGAIEKFQTFMMRPHDVMALAKESSSGVDAVTQKMANAYGSVMEMQQKVLENAMSLNQGGSPMVDMIREGAAHVKELAERYVTTSNRAKQVEAQSQAAIAHARAQSEAIQAQAQAQIVNAQSRTQMQTAVPAAPPRPAAQPQAGLGDAPPTGRAAFEEWKKRHDSSTAQPEKPRETVEPVTPVATPVASNGNTHSTSRTDLEWFGPALDEVLKTRHAVSAFFVELQKGAAAKIDQDSATPDRVAHGIGVAAGFIQQNNIPVPAMTELLFAQRYDEFVRVLLPDANENYWNDLVHELRVLNGEIDPDDEQEGDPDDGEGEQGEDGSPADDVQDGSPAHVARPQPTIRVIDRSRA